MPKVLYGALAVTLLLTTSGCGNTTTGRIATGAGIGAATGAVVSIATSGNPFIGILVGGTAGALVGALSDREMRL